jgi:hypothetical protein
VDRRTDLSALASSIARATDIVSFRYEPPTLSQLFRQTVGV